MLLSSIGLFRPSRGLETLSDVYYFRSSQDHNFNLEQQGSTRPSHALVALQSLQW